MTALGVIVGWCALPVVGSFIIERFARGPFSTQTADFLSQCSAVCSPLAMTAFNEFSALHEFCKTTPWIPIILNFCLYYALLCLIRHRCLRHADTYLRR